MAIACAYDVSHWYKFPCLNTAVVYGQNYWYIHVQMGCLSRFGMHLYVFMFRTCLFTTKYNNKAKAKAKAKATLLSLLNTQRYMTCDGTCKTNKKTKVKNSSSTTVTHSPHFTHRLAHAFYTLIHQGSTMDSIVVY
jgi:hypothetical protein